MGLFGSKHKSSSEDEEVMVIGPFYGPEQADALRNFLESARAHVKGITVEEVRAECQQWREDRHIDEIEAEIEEDDEEVEWDEPQAQRPWWKLW